MPKIPVKGSYLMPKSMCSWIPNPKHPDLLKRYLYRRSSSSSAICLSPSSRARGSHRPCRRGLWRAWRSFRFSWCWSFWRCIWLWRELVFGQKDPQALWRLSGLRVTFGEFIAWFTHTDIQNELFDPDLTHGILLLSLWLLRDLLWHAMAKIYRLILYQFN